MTKSVYSYFDDIQKTFSKCSIIFSSFLYKFTIIEQGMFQ